MSLTEFERETTVTMSDGDGIALVYSAQRKIITRLRHNPAAELIEEGVHEGSAWARFRIPARLISFRTSEHRPELTEEQRERLRERARKNFAPRAARAESA